MDRWHLPSVDVTGKREPRVLFSRPACRAVVIDLQGGESMGEHQVRENAVLEVVSGRLAVETDGRTVECEAGTLVVFEPGERHAVRALQPCRVLLLLAPWPGKGHYEVSEGVDPDRLPQHAQASPLKD